MVKPFHLHNLGTALAVLALPLGAPSAIKHMACFKSRQTKKLTDRPALSKWHPRCKFPVLVLSYQQGQRATRGD